MAYLRISENRSTIASRRSSDQSENSATVYARNRKERRNILQSSPSVVNARRILNGIGRSLQHLIETIKALEKRGIGFKSLTEHIDTITPGRKLIFHIFGALADFERKLIRERTNAGLQAARARGRKGGSKSKVTPQKAVMAQELYNSKKKTVAEICQGLNISRVTFYRDVQTDEEKIGRSIFCEITLQDTVRWKLYINRCIDKLHHLTV